jgi:hypothetical protein
LHKRILQLKPKVQTVPDGGLTVLIGTKIVAYSRTHQKGDMFQKEWQWVHVNFRFQQNRT